MSELKIEIPVQAKLDSKSSKGLESQISGAVENKVFEIKAKIGEASLASIQTQIKKAIETSVGNTSPGFGNQGSGRGATPKIRFDIDVGQSNLNAVESRINTLASKVQVAFKGAEAGAQAGINSVIDKARSDLSRAQEVFSGIQSGGNNAKGMAEYSGYLNKTNASLKEATAALAEYKSAQAAAAVATDKGVASTKKYDATVEKIQNKLSQMQWMRSNYGRAFSDGTWAQSFSVVEEGFQTALTQGATPERVKQLSDQLEVLKQKARAAGEAGKTFGQRFQEGFAKFASWFSISQLFMGAINKTQQMVEAVKEIDKAMTSVRKVTDESSASYARYMESALSRSADLAAQVPGYIEATAGWARMGYDMEEAQRLGELSTIYYNVGDGVETVDDATNSLISTMKAFNIQAGDAEGILDKLNYVGNNFGITSGGLGEILQRSAASLSAANTDLVKSIAIGTAGNEIINDPQKVGNGLKTLAMRLRGSTAELEAAGEEVDEYVTSTSKMQEGIKALTGVDIMKSATEYKDIYQILLEISRVFGKLTDVSQASLVEMMFGKVQGNLGTAILKNFGTAEKIYDELTNGMSEGSAMKEYETYLDSVEGKANKLSATLAKTSISVLDPETLKIGYDFLTNILEVINGIAGALGGLKTVAAVAMGALTVFKPETALLQTIGTGENKKFVPFWGAWDYNREQMQASLQNDLKLLQEYQNVVGNQQKMDSAKGRMSMFAQSEINFDAIAAGGKQAADEIERFNGQAQEMQGSLTFGGKLKSIANGFKGLGRALVSAGAQMAAVTIAMFAIEGIANAIDNWVHAYEKSVEKVNELNSKWADMAEKQKEVQEITTGDSAERFLELSEKIGKGDAKTSLVAEEYKEYQNLVNQLASNFPSLVGYWDNEGNAVLNLKGDVQELREELEKLYEESRQNERSTRIADFETNEADFRRLAFSVENGSILKARDYKRINELLSSEEGTKTLAEAYDSGDLDLLNNLIGSKRGARSAVEVIASYIKYYQNEYASAGEAIIAKRTDIQKGLISSMSKVEAQAKEDAQYFRDYVLDSVGNLVYVENVQRSSKGQERISGEVENLLVQLASGYLSDMDFGTTENLSGKIEDDFSRLISNTTALEKLVAAGEEFQKNPAAIDAYRRAIIALGVELKGLNTSEDDDEYDAMIDSLVAGLISDAENVAKTAQGIGNTTKEYEGLKASYTKYTEAREKAISALSNLNETGYVTPEDMESIRSAGLEGALRQTSYGSTYVDYARMRELDRSKAQEEIGEQLDYIRQQTEACTKAQEELNAAAAAGDKERVEGLKDSISAYAQNIEGAYLMISALEKSTSALNAFKEAMNSMDLDDNFKSAKSALDEILKALETGKFNTDQFVTAMELVGGTDFLEKFRKGIISEKDLGDWVENLGKYYTEDGEIDRRRAFDRFVDADIGHYFEGENGETRFAFNQGTTMQDIQDALGGISGELATAFLDAINAYAKDPDTETIGPEDYKKESERRKEAEEALKQVQQMNVSAQNISLNADNVTVEGDQGSGDSGERDPNQSSLPAQASTPTPITDITAPWLNENGEPIVSELTIDSTGAQTAIENLKQEVSEIEANIILEEIGTEAIQKLKEEVDNPTELQVGADTSEGTASVQNLETFAKQRVVKPVAANTSNAIAAANTLHSNLSRPATKTVFVRQIGGGTLLGGGPIAADGTDNAKGGTTLVGEIAPEIIVSRKTGTWRLVESPQLTNLGRGDIVFNGEQTKKILAGKPASMGKALAKGNFPSKKVPTLKDYGLTVSSEEKPGAIGKYSQGNNWMYVYKTTSQAVPGGKGGSSGKGGGGGSGGAGGNEEPKSLVRDLYDWIERAIEVAKKATQKLIDAVAEKVGYINKNKTLDEALAATAKEIEVNQAGYNRYMEHVKSLQQRYGFGDDMLERAKNGEINIADYEGDLKNQVEDFVMWYEKAEKAQETVEELKQQEVDLARQKLDNIDEYYTKKVDRLEAALDKNSAKLDKKVAAGQEVTAKDYEDAIKATQDKILTLQEEREAFASQFDALVASGVITPDSDKWHEYMSTLEDIDQTIIETETDLIGLNDEMAQIPLTNLQYALDRLNAIQSQIKGFQSFHDAQGTDSTESTYNDLIQNGFEQIKNLQEQNEYLKAQQSGLDVLSEKWQELQGQIDDNNDSIWDIKTSQEEWNDAIADLKIEQLQKQRDELEKTNEALEKKKEMEDALEELERAKTQRTKLIYREGIGFVYEADQNKIKEAQDRVDELRHQETLDKIDEAIDAIEDNKKNDNVYDYEGNQVIKDFGSVNVQALYASALENMDISGLLSSIISRSAQQNMDLLNLTGETGNPPANFTFGDFYLSGVNDTDGLAQAIVNELPNRILQRLYS
jgi:TP901 family phage tail tape measure protein